MTAAQVSRVALWTLCVVAILASCARRAGPPAPATPALSLEDAARRVRPDVKDKEGWARAILAALDAHELHADAAAVCSVLAVIEQESGYEPDPVVPGLAKIARERLEEKAKVLGPLGPAALRKLLEGKAPGTTRTFDERLSRVRTERDLDLLFRHVLGYYRAEFPMAYALADLARELGSGAGLRSLNPITTAGSMQVSVRFAVELEESREEGQVDEWEIRERLYTREGGVYFGAARLLGFEAGYDVPLYRFADYNAGFYASRNAAVQEQLSELTGHKLALDGDLLAYDDEGKPASVDSNTLRAFLDFRERIAPALGERELRRDLRKEKSFEFEETATFRSIKAAWELKHGARPAYARLPDVALVSPKLRTRRSTAWFARAVDRRYRECLTERGRAAPAPALPHRGDAEARPPR